MLSTIPSIFVFDDLERCDCPINEVFGFLNEIVEHENTKVIIVANEKEISGTVNPEYLELQYLISLDERIDWPKPEKSGMLSRYNNKNLVSLDEIERRSGLLFPSREADSDYKKIREKLIGVTLKYEPDLPKVITEIIGKSSCSEDLKKILSDKIEYFKSTMMLYKHRNLRTFQFFLSKVSYLIERLSEFPIESDYYEQIRSHVIEETFNLAVKFKSNFQPPRDNYNWLRTEQKISLKTVKKYIETGTLDGGEFWQDILNLQTELKAHIPEEDPYYTLYQLYYLHSQDWCEQNLEELLNRLENNKYPVAIYGKILITIQRLINLGFDESYMDRAKAIMLSNISNMGEVKGINKDILWLIDDMDFKKQIQEIISEINIAINNHTEIVSYENVSGILKHEDWVERLKKYVDPNDNGYVDDVSVFGKASSSDWLSCLYRASPAEIYLFRDLIYLLYPRNTKRTYYSEDANTIKKITSELKKYEETDLIKKANIKWLIDHLERIIELHEPTMPYREATLTSET